MRKTNTYNSVCNANNYCREEFCPTVNLKEVTEDQIQGCAKPWSFDSLPGVNLKTMSLAEDPQSLERLNQRLSELEPLGLWHEPLELNEQAGKFFKNVK